MNLQLASVLPLVCCNLGTSQPLLSSQVSCCLWFHRGGEGQATNFCLRIDHSRFLQYKEGCNKHLHENVALALLLMSLLGIKWISCTGTWHERICFLSIHPWRFPCPWQNIGLLNAVQGMCRKENQGPGIDSLEPLPSAVLRKAHRNSTHSVQTQRNDGV